MESITIGIGQGVAFVTINAAVILTGVWRVSALLQRIESELKFLNERLSELHRRVSRLEDTQ